MSPVPPGGTGTDAFRQSAALISVAERAGYERYWVAEHHGIGHRNAGSAPEVLVAHLATLTSRIRVGSGAVLIDKYRPYKVADTFRVLHSLFPGRIDLGVGRGSSPPPVEAALGGADDYDDDPMFAPLAAATALMAYREQLAELLAWLSHDFPPEHPYAAYPLSPGVAGGPQPWLLGSSAESAVLAGQLGMRYCFAAFLNPRDAPSVLSVYRAAFRPSSDGAVPYTMLAVSAVCAPTDEEADLLRAGAELHARRVADRDRAVDLPLPTPAQALAQLGHVPAPVTAEPGHWPRHLSGSPERVHEQLALISAESGAQELMICDFVGDHTARLRSYELLARRPAEQTRGVPHRYGSS
ncbi:MsnO8 family LLM class oxidoreductase [Streptomyces sp. NPDC050287]|uniref:MsnO8 family LLM class oxidoreductase n=1 Tax=Streptomyces sp. NPDC050287 TaxID=3365608 RepID=UPI0037991330